MRLLRKIIFSALFAFGSYGFSQTPGAGLSDNNGNTYQTVIIGTQEWMAENLRTYTYSDGSIISQSNNWITTNEGMWSYLNNDYWNGELYGKLYNGYTITDPRNLCPNGWHVPNDTEWNSLIDYLGGDVYAATKMKSTGTISQGTGLWYEGMAGVPQGTNESGFSAQPAGYRLSNGDFSNFGNPGFEARFWSSTLDESGNPNSYILYFNYFFIYSEISDIKYGASIRCLKGSGLAGTEKIQLDKKELVKIIDLIGRETEFRPNTMLIYIYSDGSTEHVLRTEE